MSCNCHVENRRIQVGNIVCGKIFIWVRNKQDINMVDEIIKRTRKG